MFTNLCIRSSPVRTSIWVALRISDRWALHSVDFGRRRQVPFAEARGWFLGENAVHTGEWEKGLRTSASERELATRIHSRSSLPGLISYADSVRCALGDPEESCPRVYERNHGKPETVGDKQVANR
jgi:hypothetical protein